ncbi:MAG: hypothetical protein ACJ8DC_02435, partial [Gemmatimonadales bacterium]
MTLGPKYRLATLAGVLALASACSDGAQAPADTLTIHGSGSAAPALATGSLASLVASPTPAADSITSGDPASMSVGMYAMYISANEDCSEPILVADYGATAQPKDFMQSPVLFTGSPAAGTYKCVIFKMSDVIGMVPATSFGACVAGTFYQGDIYRDGETDWKDAELNPIIGTGTDDAPLDDHVAIFLTGNPAAVEARGVSENQVVLLHSDLIVPGQSTFYWNAQGSVT